MANQFGGNPGERISWANGLTSVLFAWIAVAAAELHQTEWQREFARWVATVDQNHLPLGCVGFDLIDIPWGEEGYCVNKQFVLEAVVHAASREVAYRLPYYPNPGREDVHRECLRAFALMAHHFDRAFIPRPWADAWPYRLPPGDVVCVRHRVFCHHLGCVVCPDEADR